MSAPAAPTGLTPTPGDGQVSLNWTAPLNDGSSPVTSYNTYKGTSSGGETLLQNTGSPATSFLATGLTNGTEYFFEATAVNTVGEGPVSNEASAIPATTPDAPTIVSVTPGNAQVVLSWTAPASDGGSAITNYKVYEGTSSGGETFLSNAAGTSYLATGLTNGTKYFFEVTAVNAVGESNFSAEAFATPNVPPPPPTSTTTTRPPPPRRVIG